MEIGAQLSLKTKDIKDAGTAGKLDGHLKNADFFDLKCLLKCEYYKSKEDFFLRVERINHQIQQLADLSLERMGLWITHSSDYSVFIWF